jgi:myo-inositol-1(or 4)-monophosphatase
MTPELDVALVAVAEAGALLRRRFLAGVTVEWKGRADVVTVADREAEGLIRAHVQDAFGDAVVGEEGAELAEPAVAGRRRWYVDPLDGTINFVKGQPRFAVSVAFCDASGLMTAAAVHLPMTGETFAAIRGEGAVRDGAVVKAADVPTAEALAQFGPLAGLEGAIPVVAPRVLSLRVTGSTVCDLVDLACGRADLFLGANQGRWDLAAGVLIAREAGAVATDLAGLPLDGPAVEAFAAGRQVHADLLPDLAAVAALHRPPGA